MRLEVRLKGKPEEVAVVLQGDTYESKDRLKSLGYRFDRNEIDWMGPAMGDTVGSPVWWKTVRLDDLQEELWELGDLGRVTAYITYAEPFK